jgi:hypothetical protein
MDVVRATVRKLPFTSSFFQKNLIYSVMSKVQLQWPTPFINVLFYNIVDGLQGEELPRLRRVCKEWFRYLCSPLLSSTLRDRLVGVKRGLDRHSHMYHASYYTIELFYLNSNLHVKFQEGNTSSFLSFSDTQEHIVNSSVKGSYFDGKNLFLLTSEREILWFDRLPSQDFHFETLAVPPFIPSGGIIEAFAINNDMIVFLVSNIFILPDTPLYLFIAEFPSMKSLRSRGLPNLDGLEGDQTRKYHLEMHRDTIIYGYSGTGNLVLYSFDLNCDCIFSTFETKLSSAKRDLCAPKLWKEKENFMLVYMDVKGQLQLKVFNSKLVLMCSSKIALSHIFRQWNAAVFFSVSYDFHIFPCQENFFLKGALYKRNDYNTYKYEYYVYQYNLVKFGNAVKSGGRVTRKL